jgi:hypothetical protein
MWFLFQVLIMTLIIWAVRNDSRSGRDAELKRLKHVPEIGIWARFCESGPTINGNTLLPRQPVTSW